MTDDYGRSLRDRADANGANKVVSALRASVPSAAKSFFSWGFPFAELMTGILMIVAGSHADGLLKVVLYIIGWFFVLGAMDAREERAKAAVASHWAECIGEMIRDDRKVRINVIHKWESMRPHLDARIAELVAQAIEEQSGKTEGGA